MLTKLKNLFLLFKENIFEKYPVTMWCIWIASIFSAIIVDEPIESDTVMLLLQKMTVFLWCFAAGTFFSEEVFSGKESWKKRIIGFVVAAVAALSVVYIGFYKGETLFGMEAETVQMNLGKFFICFYAWLFVLCVYHIFRKTGGSFEKYVISVFGNAVKTSVVYGLFALGLLFLVLIVEVLLFDTGSFLTRIEIALAGGIYVPGMILAVSRVQEKPGRFFGIVVKFVLMPLTMAAFVVIYLYIIKLIVTWNLPSNEVFSILAALFCCGLPIWTMARYFEDSKFGIIAKFLPYAFAPFIILQAICVGLRINQYGLTEQRYMGCFLIVFEILYLIIYSISNRKHLPMISMVLVGLVTIYLIVPVLNCERMVYLSQKSRLEGFLVLSQEERNQLSDDEKKMVCGAYRELSYSRFGEKYIDGMKESDIDWIKECGDYINNYYVSKNRRIYAYQFWEQWDISGYNVMYKVSGVQSDENSDGIKLTNFKFKSNGEVDFALTMDVSSFVEAAIAEGETDVNDWLAMHYEIADGNGGKLLIERVGILIKKDKPVEISLSGYYLR